MPISAIQPSADVVSAAGAARKSGGDGNGLPGAATGDGGAGKVSLSAAGRTLSELPPLELPTRENIKRLSSDLSGKLQSLFADAGIAAQPPAEFDVDPYTGKVSVKQNRPDAQRIAELIAAHPDVEMQIHNIAAMSSHAQAIEKALEADAAYRAANSPAEVEAVVRKYASVYAGHVKVTDFSLLFDGAGVQVNADGRMWMPSGA